MFFSLSNGFSCRIENKKCLNNNRKKAKEINCKKIKHTIWKQKRWENKILQKRSWRRRKTKIKTNTINFFPIFVLCSCEFNRKTSNFPIFSSVLKKKGKILIWLLKHNSAYKYSDVFCICSVELNLAETETTAWHNFTIFFKYSHVVSTFNIHFYSFFFSDIVQNIISQAVC